MQHTTRRIAFLAALVCLALAVPANAAKKSIYIKPFAITQGLHPKSPVSERIKDYISEVIVEKGGYTLTSDDEVKQVMVQEEMRMSLDTCYDDACMKKLMESLRTDYIIFGTVSFEQGRYHVTAKMLDRTSGTVSLARVKSLQFRDANKLKMASRDLAFYLIDGKAVDMARYDDAYQAVMEAYEKKVPSGLSAYFMYFMPLKAPFKDYYDALMGAGLEYCHSFNYYLAITGGAYYVQGKDESGDVTVSLNSYSVGARAGYPLFGFMYPYLGIAGRFTWYSERTSGDSVNFYGGGGDAYAGCAFIVWRTLTIWADFDVSIAKLNDSESTDISGMAVRGGLMYRF